MRLTKRFILTVGDQEITAELTRGDGPDTLRLADGEGRDLDARRVLGGKAWSVRSGNRHYLIHLTRGEHGKVAATLDGRPVSLTVLDEMRALAMAEMAEQDSGGVLSADIPGLVVEIKVEPGQRVARGEPVIVVEAMKMQNELGAGIDGVVAEIPVAEGQAVNPGDTLVIIEPAAD